MKVRTKEEKPVLVEGGRSMWLQHSLGPVLLKLSRNVHGRWEDAAG